MIDKIMRTNQEMMELILRVAQKLQVKAVALSGSRANPSSQKDNFQDYDIVYVLDHPEDWVVDTDWLDAFGFRLIEQHNRLGHRHLFLMLFEDGNRIDLTLCPVQHLDEWVQSEPHVEVLSDTEGLFSNRITQPQQYWVHPVREVAFQQCCNEFWWVSTYVVKGICRKELIYATDHLYRICQQELLQIWAWQVATIQGPVDIGKNYKYLFDYLPDETEKAFSAILDFSNFEKVSSSLLATQNLFYKASRSLAETCHFEFDHEMAENILKYTKNNLPGKDEVVREL